jgi:hypothetical protein
LLRTSVFDELRARAGAIVIVAPFADEPWFRDEFVHGNVSAVRMARHAPRPVERRLFSALYNLYLAGPTPHSLQLFLDRWADNHPSIGWLRTSFTRRLLPACRWLSPLLERVYSRFGDTGGYRALIAREQPDVAVFSRLFFCDEIPLMRAAVQAGVPTVGAVASWDNLTTKGPLLPRLDRLLVWNELLKDEAIRYHAYGPEEVLVTGAPHHDIAFAGGSQFADRASFFERLGLDPRKKLITYAGEDPVIAPDAPSYVEEIAAVVRRNGLSMPCQLLVRPHPQDDLARYERIRRLPDVIFDLPGKPSDKYWMDMTRRDLLHLCETLIHSDVVVNVTSTIVVDAAFFDTPSICIGYGYTHPKTHFNSPMRFFEMDHFRHVIDDGATCVVESPEELRAAIDRYLLDPSRDREGRMKTTRRIAQYSDGGSGKRTADAILRSARTAAWQAAPGEENSTAGEVARERAI